MPKQVDHEQRRRELAAALWRIAADGGLEAVSLGQVATEAGVSKGLVQHYFHSRDEMLAHTAALLRERLRSRIERSLADATAGTPKATLRAMLLALLPVDAESRTEALVGNAFLIRAISDDEVAGRFRAGQAELRDGVATLITAGQEHGEFAAELDALREADILLAVTGGMGDALLVGTHDPADATAVLEHQLDRLAR